MANKFITALESTTTLPNSAVLHVVDTTFTTPNAEGKSFKITKENFLKENTAAILINTNKVGITPSQATAITNNTTKVGITPAQATAISDNTSATVTNASAASTNATAILTKLGKSTSTIAVSEVDVLTAAAYAALSTKIATKLYFTI